MLIPTLAYTQGWERTYGRTYNDVGHSVQQTTDGGYIITGYTDSYLSSDSSDVYLIKTDNYGDTLWTKIYGGPYNHDRGYSVQQTTDEGYIIAGGTYSYGYGGSDVYLIKTDNNGDTLWTKTYGGSYDDYGYSVQQTFDQGYIITGRKQISYSEINVYLIKTNSNGDSIWTKTIDSGLQGNSVQQCTDGGFIITADGANLIKTDSYGDTLWTKIYDFGENKQSTGNSVQQTTDGGYIITGTISENHVGAVFWKMFLMKTDSSGDTLWTRFNDGGYAEYGYSVQQTTDNGYIVICNNILGDAWSPPPTDMYLIKTDYNGDTLWTKKYGNGTEDGFFGHSVKQTLDGGYIITGYKGIYDRDVYLIKTDENGDVLFITDIPTPSPNRKLIKTIDFLGREISNPIYNKPFIEIYDDGSARKRIIIE